VSGLDTAALGAWLDDQARQHEFNGVALVTEGGETVFEHAAGLAHRGHGVPIVTKSRFQVASVTKMITAATALKLVEEGSLSLDRPLTSFLPADRRPAALDDRHTLHHLLSHTSALPNYHDEEDETWGSFTIAMERIPFSRARGPMDLYHLFAELPAAGDLGEFAYRDSNFIMIGVLIEWVSGRDFGEVARDKVLLPAGMTDTDFAELDLEPAGFATGYVVSDEPPERWRSNIYQVPARGMPDGGLTTTARDLDLFIGALGTGKILEPETVAKMLTPHGLEEGTAEAYGYGMELVVDDGSVTIHGHSGLDPGVSSMVSHYVDRDVTVIVLCNQDRGSWPVTQRIASALGIDDPRE
jgi:CubicO group peptidase (beta-lactamase class C family)